MDRQLIQIGNECLYERRLHISVQRSLVGKRLDEAASPLCLPRLGQFELLECALCL
jgi:hypothetical protein